LSLELRFFLALVLEPRIDIALLINSFSFIRRAYSERLEKSSEKTLQPVKHCLI